MPKVSGGLRPNGSFWPARQIVQFGLDGFEGVSLADQGFSAVDCNVDLEKQLNVSIEWLGWWRIFYFKTISLFSLQAAAKSLFTSFFLGPVTNQIPVLTWKTFLIALEQNKTEQHLPPCYEDERH